jgi:hypothetical protein
MKCYATYREKIKLQPTTTFKYILAMYFQANSNKLICVCQHFLYNLLKRTRYNTVQN